MKKLENFKNDPRVFTDVNLMYRLEGLICGQPFYYKPVDGGMILIEIYEPSKPDGKGVLLTNITA